MSNDLIKLNFFLKINMCWKRFVYNEKKFWKIGFKIVKLRFLFIFIKIMDM